MRFIKGFILASGLNAFVVGLCIGTGLCIGRCIGESGGASEIQNGRGPRGRRLS
jgi:hypothetical protein